MATLNDLRHLRPNQADHFAATEWNPFLREDIFSGAQVLQVRHDALRSSLSIILELRVSDYDWQACAGLISASEVTEYALVSGLSGLWVDGMDNFEFDVEGNTDA